MIPVIVDTDISKVYVQGRDTEKGGTPGAWSDQAALTIQRDGDGRPTEAALSAALVTAAGLLDEQTTAVRVALDVTDGGLLIRTVEYQLCRWA